jgi:hypothetical protein
MAAVARRGSLRNTVGETLLTSKLQILNGTGNRRPSIALSILTGRIAEQLTILENFYAADPVVAPLTVSVQASTNVIEQPGRSNYVPRTVYLSERHLRDIDSIIEVFSRQQVEPKRLNRSAVLRRAIEFLRTAAEADPAKSVLEKK